jgi:hypothetical protein
MNMHTLPVAQRLAPDFLAFMLAKGALKPRREPQPTRWQRRAAAGVPHQHLKEKTKRREQQIRIEAKRQAARAITRRHGSPTPSAIRREIRNSPHVYM